MLINKNDPEITEEEVIPTQLLSIKYPDVFAVTESGKVVKVTLTEQQKNDDTFWCVLKKIMKNKIWIPLSKSQYKLYDDDWLAVE